MESPTNNTPKQKLYTVALSLIRHDGDNQINVGISARTLWASSKTEAVNTVEAESLKQGTIFAEHKVHKFVIYEVDEKLRTKPSSISLSEIEDIKNLLSNNKTINEIYRAYPNKDSNIIDRVIELIHKK